MRVRAPALDADYFGFEGGEAVSEVGDAVAGGEGGGAGGGDGFDGAVLICGGCAFGFAAGADAGFGGGDFGLGCVGCGGGFAPAGEERARLRNTDLGGDEAVAFGGAGLAFQRGGAGVLVGNDLVELGEIGFGGAEFPLGVFPPDVQPGDTGGFLQHGAAVGGLGGDDRADLALADERGGVRAGRGVGEEQADVLCADVAAVDAVGGAGAALDPADDLALVSRDLCKDRDFGEVARRAGRGAGEDDVFHAGAAQGFRAGLAHRPAEGFEEVGFAAAIGADDAGEAGFDAEIGGVYETLEAGDAEALDLHSGAPRRLWFRSYPGPLRRCFPAKAGTQTGLPPSRENNTDMPSAQTSTSPAKAGAQLARWQ
jgi:hypothetical protein